MKKRILLFVLAIVLTLGALSAFAIVGSAETPTPVLKISYCNLSFRDSVCIKYAVSSNVTEMSLLIWSEPQESYTVGTQDATLTEYTTESINGESYKVFDYTALAAKQMTDVVYARAYAVANGENHYSEVRKYSILQYAYNKLGKTATASSDEELKEMLTVMLSYGAAAQKYLNDYKIDRLATADWYQVKLTAGTLEDGCNHGLYLPGDKVILTAPATDAEGKCFARWVDGDGNEVATTATFELTVGSANALYTPVYEAKEERFTVTFVDYDGTVLKEETVDMEGEATAPADPRRNGYDFIGWDKEYSKITESITVTAQYQIVENQVCINYIENPDGTVTANFSINGNVNIAMLELQMHFELQNATYSGYSISAAGMGDANYVDGIFYFSFMSATDVTTDTDLFSITFEVAEENVDIAFTVEDSCVSDGSFTNITAATVVGTSYNK